MAGDAGDGPSAKAKPHPPIRSEFGRRFARVLKLLEQASVDSFDQAFGEAKRLFRERYDACLLFWRGADVYLSESV